MGAKIRITNSQGELLESYDIPQAGSNLRGRIVAGVLVEYAPAVSEATWTYNYHPVWKEIGWNIFRWLDEKGGRVEISIEVLYLLQSKLRKIKELPYQDLDRINTDGGYWAAAPKNAAAMIDWIITWANEPGANYIERV